MTAHKEEGDLIWWKAGGGQARKGAISGDAYDVNPQVGQTKPGSDGGGDPVGHPGDVPAGNWMACGEGIEGTEQESGTEAQKLPEVSC